MSTDKKHIIFDPTILNCIQLCAQRTQYEYEMDLRPPTKGEGLEEGDLLHVMMEAYYLGIKVSGTELLYSNEMFAAHVEKCIAIGEQHSVTLDLNLAEVSAVIYQFGKYTSHYRMDGMTPLEVERPFLVPVWDSDDLSIHLAGKIDIIGDFPNFGLGVMDHKKAKRTEVPSSLSNQFTAYSFATGIRTVFVNKVGFQKTLSEEERFKRYPIYYTEDQIEQWRKNTIYWGQQYAFYLENNTWPENRTSCDKYAGCIFETLCAASTIEAREHLIKAHYVVGEKWDVTAVLNKGRASNVQPIQK